MLELAAFAFVNLLGLISPGPDFAIVTHYGMKGSRRAAFLASLGVTTACLIHVFYCLLGIAIFLQNSPLLFQGIQLLGAGYLIYVGLRIWFPKKEENVEKRQDISRGAFTTGFLTNLLNPKATLFFLSVFTQFVTPETSFSMKLAFGITIPIMVISWFSLLSFLFTHPSFLPHLQRYQRTFSTGMGGLLILLALSVIGHMIF